MHLHVNLKKYVRQNLPVLEDTETPVHVDFTVCRVLGVMLQ